MKKGRHFRNFVSPFAILSASLLLMACGASVEGEQRTDPNRSIERNLSVQKTKPSVESAMVSDDSTYTDSTLSQSDLDIESPDDSIANYGIDDDPNLDFADDPELIDDTEYLDEGGEWSTELTDTEMDIEKDRLLSTSMIRVIRPGFADQRDSVLAEVEKRLRITPERIPAMVVVEKWVSPVNFRGYKFNQRKLILFGVREEQAVAIYYYIDNYYFSLGERYYALDEALAFEPFQNLVDTTVVRHLRTHENSL